jgi:WD40 repeat protein
VWLGLSTGVVELYNISSIVISTGIALTGHTKSTGRIVQINANQVATASNDNTIKVWNIDTGTLVNTYYGHIAGGTPSLAILPSGLLVSGGGDKTLRVWNLQAQTMTVVNTTGTVANMKLNPVTGLLVIRNYEVANNTVGYYNSTTLALVLNVGITLNYNDLEILLPSGNVVMAGYNMTIFDTTGAKIYSLLIPGSQIVNRFKLLSDNVTLANGMGSGSVLLFNTNNNSFGASVTGHSSSINLVTLTPDLLFLLTGGQDSKVLMWTWSTMSVNLVKTYTVAGIMWSGAIIPSLGRKWQIFLFQVYSHLSSIYQLTDL